MNKKLTNVMNIVKQTINIDEESKSLNKRLNKLENVLSIVYDELYDDFADGIIELPHVESEGVLVINPFYSECMRFEENPFEYYNMTMEQMEEFFNFYNIK